MAESIICARIWNEMGHSSSSGPEEDLVGDRRLFDRVEGLHDLVVVLLTTRVHGGIDESNDPFSIHYISDPAGDAPLRIMDAVVGGRRLHPVRDQWKWNTVMAVGPGLMAGHVVDAYSQDLSARGVDLVAYRLKDGQLICSTTGKVTRVEPDNQLGSLQSAQRHVFAGVSWQGEIRSLVSDLEWHQSNSSQSVKLQPDSIDGSSRNAIAEVLYRLA